MEAVNRISIAAGSQCLQKEEQRKRQKRRGRVVGTVAEQKQ